MPQFLDLKESGGLRLNFVKDDKLYVLTDFKSSSF